MYHNLQGTSPVTNMSNTDTSSRKEDELEVCFFYSTTLFHDKSSEFRDNLRKVLIIGLQDLTGLNAISELTQLQELWIVECGIKEAPKVNKNIKLERLYLYTNQIENIPDLSSCAQLRILYMSNNNIHNIKSLERVPSLEELNIADNKIEDISVGFPTNSQLRDINFSGNPIFCIQDVQNLVPLKKLHSVVFADALYRMCPITTVCNYRWYIINYLQRIKKLDHFPVTQGERSWVHYFFKTQISYYDMLFHMKFNLCLATLKQRYSDYCKLIREHRNKVEKQLIQQHKLINTQVMDWNEEVMIQLKIYKQQLLLSINSCGNITFDAYDADSNNEVLQVCKNILVDSICSNMKELGITGIIVHKVVKVVHKELAIQNWWQSNNSERLHTRNVVFRILASLPGVSNIKLWPFRFFQTVLLKAKKIGVTDCLGLADAQWLNVNLFRKEKLTATSCSKRRICILVQSPIDTQPEKGLFDKNSSKVVMKHLFCMKQQCHNYKLDVHHIQNPMFVIEYEYIVTGSPEHTGPFHNNYEHIKENNEICVSYGDIIDIRNIEYKKVYSLVKICLSGQELESLDINLELPNLRELDVSYNKLKTFPRSRILAHINSLNISFNNITVISIEENLPALQDLNISWNNLISCISTCQTLMKYTPNLTELNIEYNTFEDYFNQKYIKDAMKHYLPKLCLSTTDFQEDISIMSEPYLLCSLYMYKYPSSQCNKTYNKYFCENMSNTTSRKQKGFKYSHIQYNPYYVSNVFKNKPKIEHLCAPCSYLMEVPIIKPMKYLTSLNLSTNFISNLENFTQDNFPVLKYLDLNNNLIRSLQPMQQFHTLHEFYCAHNQLSHMLEIENLRTWHGLFVIDLSYNPIESNEFYKKFIISYLPNIKYISGKYIECSEVLKVKSAFGIILDMNILKSMYESDYLTMITQLKLNNCGLKEIQLYSDNLPYLESLDLSNNEINAIWGLHSFQNLQTLCLSHNALENFYAGFQDDSNITFASLCTLLLDYNKINSVRSFSSGAIPKLKHLFLNFNNIEVINDIVHCHTLETLILDNNNIKVVPEFPEDNNIKFLSLENNKVQSLQFTKSLKKLGCLYIANNCVTDESEFNCLEIMPNLTELSFVGNSVSVIINRSNAFVLRNDKCK